MFNAKIGNLWKIISIIIILSSMFRKIYMMKYSGIILKYGENVVIWLNKIGNIKVGDLKQSWPKY